MNIKRTSQVSEEVKRKLSEIVQHKLKDPRIPDIISISNVEVTNDLSFAKVYISVLSTKEDAINDAIEGLNSAKGFIKKELSKAVKLRAMPELIFKPDDSIEQSLKMYKLIDEVTNGDL